MNCASARRAIVEAPSESLRGTDDSPLATHLQACAECHALAQAMVAQEDVLGRALDVAASTHSVEKTLLGVHARLDVVAADEMPNRRRRRPWRPAIAVLAAAAVVAAVALWGPRPDSSATANATPDEDRGLPALATHARPPLGDGLGNALMVESQRRFALMQTDEPTISVVWFY